MRTTPFMLLRNLLGVVGVLALSGLMLRSTRAQVPDAPVRGFTFPILDAQTLAMKARVRGEVAQPLGPDRVQVEGVKIESYGEDDRTNLVVLTERCLLYVEERRLESQEALNVASGNGQLALSGLGFTWDETNGLVILRDVRARLERPQPVGATASPAAESLQIESAQFTYREGRADFSDGVQVREGEDRLSCDRLGFQLQLAPGDLAPGAGGTNLAGQVESIHAEGAVEVVASALSARAAQADYRMGSQQLQLTGDVEWRSEDREGRADTILLERPTDRLWAEGNVWMQVPTRAFTAASPFGGSPARGAEAPAMVEVRSDTLEVLPDPEAPHISYAHFRDQVRVNQGEDTVECEELTVRYGDEALAEGETGRPREPRAREGLVLVEARTGGGVTFRQSTNQVTGARAVYTAESGLMEVDGPVVWELEGNLGRADRLRLNPVAQTAEALGRVHLDVSGDRLGPVSQALGGGMAGSSSGSPETGGQEAEDAAAVEIDCDSLRYREPGQGREFGVADFRGDVRVRNGPDLNLQCERMLAEIETATNALHRLVATGAVVIEARDERGRREARGDRAEYVAREDRLWLTGENGVTMDLEDDEGIHRGRGRLAVYESGSGVLELRGDAVMESVHGRLTGDVVRVDRLEQVLSAGGHWKMVIPVKGASETLSSFGEGQPQP